MREILFRGKTDRGEWVVGNLMVYYDGSASIIESSTSLNTFHVIFPETVGQYTGLTDKNGRKIFEGDICDFSILDRCHTPVKITIKYGCVGFEPLYYDSVHPDDRKWRSFWQNDEDEMWNTDYFSVIGNIYDNPKLLNN